MTKALSWNEKTPFLGIFGQKIENDIFIFEISTLEFV